MASYSPGDHDWIKVRRATLIKGRDTYAITYEPHRTADAIATLAEWAADPNLNFDWLDAAIISYQMGRQLDNEEIPYTGPTVEDTLD